eukprot:945542-Prymnesium_polylepis.1
MMQWLDWCAQCVPVPPIRARRADALGRGSIAPIYCRPWSLTWSMPIEPIILHLSIFIELSLVDADLDFGRNQCNLDCIFSRARGAGGRHDRRYVQTIRR